MKHPRRIESLSFAVIFISLLLTQNAGFASSITLTGKIFEKGTDLKSDRKVALFLFQGGQENSQNKAHYYTRYLNLDGTVAMAEDSYLEDGKLVRYAMDQQQLFQKAEAVVRDNRIYFTFTEKGKTDTDDEKLRDPLVAGPSIIDFIWKNESILEKGDEPDLRYIVADRLTTYGFELKKTAEKTINGEKIVTVRFKATGFFVKAFVSAVEIVINSSRQQLISFEGHSPIKRFADGAWQNWDTITVIDSQVESPSKKGL